MSLLTQPDIFGAKFVRGLCLFEQLRRLIPEEMENLFAGTLIFPIEDPVGEEIELLDAILERIQDRELETFTA